MCVNEALHLRLVVFHVLLNLMKVYELNKRQPQCNALIKYLHDDRSGTRYIVLEEKDGVRHTRLKRASGLCRVSCDASASRGSAVRGAGILSSSNFVGAHQPRACIRLLPCRSTVALSLESEASSDSSETDVSHSCED